jgi:hypothetical protein
MSLIHETTCPATASGLNDAIEKCGIVPSQIVAIFEVEADPRTQADSFGRPMKLYRVIWHE